MTAEQLLQQARQAYQQGQKQSAASYLKQAVQLYPHDYRVWLMLAQVAPHQQAREECVAQAAKLAPHNPAVQKAQKWVQQQAAPAAEPEPLAELRQQLQNRPVTPQPKPTPTSKKWLWFTLFGLGLLLIGLTGLWQFRPTAEELTAGVNQTEALAQIPPSSTPELPTATPTNTPLPPTVTPQPTDHPIRAKPVGQTGGEPRATWTPTPSPSPTPSPTPTPRPTFTADEYASRPALIGPNEKWIDVNLTTQRLVAYEGDEAVFATDISSGRYPYNTVTGQFRIYLRLDTQTMDGRRLGFDYVTENVPYVQYFYGDFALHGAFWHNDFGTPVSHGCVNLTVDDSQWLYNWATYGTLVNVHH